MRSEVKYDPDAVTFLTDLTPSLYYLLGQKPVVNNALLGRPLFTGSLQEQQQYLRDSYLIASSYAPVYGMLSHNGHSLYIADGVNFREYAYELSPDGSSREVPVSDDRRDQDQKRIRAQVNDIASYYRLR
jgi:hypothetical protein